MPRQADLRPCGAVDKGKRAAARNNSLHDVQSLLCSASVDPVIGDIKLSLAKPPLGVLLSTFLGLCEHLGRRALAPVDRARTPICRSWMAAAVLSRNRLARPRPKCPHTSSRADTTSMQWSTRSQPSSCQRMVKSMLSPLFIPLVSSSANPAGARPARESFQVRRYFGNRLDYLLPGAVGGAGRPTGIRDLVSGKVIRD